MPIPFLALFAAGALGQGILNQRSSQRRSEAFAQGLAGFVRQPGDPEIATGFPGFSPAVGQSITDLFNVDANAGRELLQFHLNLAEGATAELRAAETATIQREEFQIRKDELTRRTEQFRRANDPDEILERGQATKGFVQVADPMTGTDRFIPETGTDAFRERVTKAISLADAQDKFTALRANVLVNGVSRVPSDPNFTTQQSLDAQFVLSVKQAENLGALDQGALDFTSLLTGEQLGAVDFLFGSDAASIQRLNTTQQMFAGKMAQETENLRLLRPGMVDSQKLRFDASQDRAQEMNRVSQQMVQALQSQAAAGGSADVQPLSLSNRSVITALLIGDQLDNITSAILTGGAVGALVGRGRRTAPGAGVRLPQ